MNKTLESIEEDMISTLNIPDYEAVDVLWVALIKIANLMPWENEHKRIMNLVYKIPDNSIKDILSNPGVDALLDLDPPLETILINKYERLHSQKTKNAIESIARNRERNPILLTVSVLETVKKCHSHNA